MASFVVESIPVNVKAEPKDLEDKSWLSTVFKKPVAAVETDAMGGAGGLNATMLKVKVTFEDQTKLSAVAKVFHADKLPSSKLFGHPRESLFYGRLAQQLQVPTPRVHFAFGDMDTGEKVILFEDLSDCIQAGYFFGAHSLHNWGKDLGALTAAAPGVTAVQVATKAFTLGANLHAKYWNSPELKSVPWLRGTNWAQGQGEESWMAAQAMASTPWKKIQEEIAAGTSDIKWDADLLNIITASMNKINFANFVAESAQHPLTMVHADYHPANMLYRPSTEELVVVDWEQVGVGRGPQDLAQFMISHTDVTARKAMETEILRSAYYDVLVQQNPAIAASGFTYEECKKEFVFGGLERWIWLLVLLAGFPLPAPAKQYFHDIVCAFYKDYSADRQDAADGVNVVVTCENIGMPRV